MTLEDLCKDTQVVIVEVKRHLGNKEGCENMCMLEHCIGAVFWLAFDQQDRIKGLENELEKTRFLDAAFKKLLETVLNTKSVREAVARGWCHPENAHKQMDAQLAEAISQEVVAELSKALGMEVKQ